MRYLYLLVLGVIHVGIYLVLRYVGHLPGDCNRNAQLTLTIIMLWILIILSYFLVRMGKVQDPFYMKFENNFGSFVMIPALLLMIIYPIAPAVFGPWFDYRWVMIFTPVSRCEELFALFVFVFCFFFVSLTTTSTNPSILLPDIDAYQ